MFIHFNRPFQFKEIHRYPTMKKTLLGLFLIGFLLALPLAFAQTDLPLWLQKLKEENQRFATDFLESVSFLIAFLAGVTTILSPCLLPVLPAFFAYMFKERKEITRMTLMFFLGFTPIFILLGVAATFAGNLFATFFRNLGFYVPLAGFFLGDRERGGLGERGDFGGGGV